MNNQQSALKMKSTTDEKVFEMILELLDGIKADNNNTISLSQHYDAINSKYGSVLKKLAE